MAKMPSPLIPGYSPADLPMIGPETQWAASAAQIYAGGGKQVMSDAQAAQLLGLSGLHLEAFEHPRWSHRLVSGNGYVLANLERATGRWQIALTDDAQVPQPAISGLADAFAVYGDLRLEASDHPRWSHRLVSGNDYVLANIERATSEWQVALTADAQVPMAAVTGLSDALAASGSVAANNKAVALAQLRGLRHVPVADPPAVLPTLSLSLATTGGSTISGGVSIGKDDTRITYSGGLPVQGGGYPYELANENRWISSPSGLRSSDWSIRFQSDAPSLEIQIGDWSGPSSCVLYVDGRPVTATSIFFPQTGTINYLRCDWGGDTQTLGDPSITVANGGAGYVAGDILTVVGGTGAAARVQVLAVSSGAVSRFMVLDYGQYTAFPGNAATTTTIGAGAGATLNVVGQGIAMSGHTTRRMRRYELRGGNAKFAGIIVPALSTVRAWPVAGVRLFGMLDSYGDTFQSHAGGAYLWRMARRLGIEDVWSNGQGGTGFIATNGGGSHTFRQRLPNIIARLPASIATPAVLWTHGSINDASASSAAALRAEVEAYYAEAFTGLPNGYLLQLGLMRSAGSTPSDSYYDAVKAGFAAQQAIYDPQGKRSAFVETRGTAFDLLRSGGRAGATNGAGNTDFYIAGDGAHPTQNGFDFMGDMLAGEIIAAARSWSI